MTSPKAMANRITDWWFNSECNNPSKLQAWITKALTQYGKERYEEGLEKALEIINENDHLSTDFIAKVVKEAMMK